MGNCSKIPVKSRSGHASSITNLVEEIQASPMDNLPDQLLVEILIKLPSQSAVQCKAVCKRWSYLLSNSYFVEQSIHTHHRFNDSRCTIFIQYFGFYIEDSNYLQASRSNLSMLEASCSNASSSNTNSANKLLDFLPQPSYVVAYCNDLLLCEGSLEEDIIYYICNPLLKQWLRLPIPPQRNGSTMVGFTCYPDSCSASLDCTSTTNVRYKYKVVRFPSIFGYNNVSDLQKRVDIYCSESGQWSEFSLLPLQDLKWWRDYTNNISVFVYNGILHWKDNEGRIIAYDTSNEEHNCRVIQLPMDVMALEEDICIGVSEGRLWMSHLQDTEVSIWELEDYDTGKWSCEREFELPTDTIFPIEPWMRSAFMYVIGFHPYDAAVLYLNFHEHGLVSFNSRLGRFDIVKEFLGTTDLQCAIFIPLLHSWWPSPVPPMLPDCSM